MESGHTVTPRIRSPTLKQAILIIEILVLAVLIAASISAFTYQPHSLLTITAGIVLGLLANEQLKDIEENVGWTHRRRERK